MARVRTVARTPTIGKVKSTGYGRTTYAMRKPKSIGRYEEPQLMSYGRGIYEQTHGCPQPLNSPETGHYPSVAVSSIEYNNSLNRMTVTFVGGGSYNYYGVNRQTYQAFCTSGSKGRYVNRNIKGSHAYQKLG